MLPLGTVRFRSVEGHDAPAVSLGQVGRSDCRVGRLGEPGPGVEDAGDRIRGRPGRPDAARLGASRVVTADEEVAKRAQQVDEEDDQGPHDLAVAPDSTVLLEEVVQGIDHQPELEDQDRYNHQCDRRCVHGIQFLTRAEASARRRRSIVAARSTTNANPGSTGHAPVAPRWHFGARQLNE